MAEEWMTPAMAGVVQAPQIRAFDLRPLSLGEILDRTFAVYRSRFWLFAGLAAIYGGVSSIASGLQATVQHLIATHMGAGIAQIEATSSTGLILLLALPVAAVIEAAILHALSGVYLGHAVSPGGSLRAVIGHWYRWIGVMLWQTWSLMWVAVLIVAPGVVLLTIAGARDYAWLGGVLIFLAIFGGGSYGVYAYLRNSLALAAATMEGSGVRTSMRRSKVLSVGAKWRVVVLGLVLWALSMVGGVLQMPLAFLIARTPLEAHIVAHAILIAVNFVTLTFVTPVGMIGIGIIYFDQRVRKEAFDLLVLMGPETVASQTPEAPRYAEASGDLADPIGSDGRI